MNDLNSEEKEKWIEDFVERETTVVSKRIEDAETATKLGQDDTRTAASKGLRSREPRQTF
jgi:hypothetical protein